MKRRLLFALTLWLVSTSSQAEPPWSQAESPPCDTARWSDTRRIWQCPNACVYLYGPPLSRAYQIQGLRDRLDDRDIRFKIERGVVSVDGKPCTELQPTEPDIDSDRPRLWWEPRLSPGDG
jgi:hypothetical protein